MISLTNLLLYSVASFGFAYILGHSGISLPARKLLDPGGSTPNPGVAVRVLLLALIECPACLGFWTGLVSALWIFSVFPGHGWMGVIGSALFTCGSNLLLARLAGLYSIEER